MEYTQLTDAIDRGDISFISQKIFHESPIDIQMDDFGLLEYARVHRQYDILSILCDALNRLPMDTKMLVYYRLFKNESHDLFDRTFLKTKIIKPYVWRFVNLLLDKSDLNSFIASSLTVLNIVTGMSINMIYAIIFSGKLQFRNYNKMFLVSCFNHNTDLVEKLLEHTDVIDFNYYEIHPQHSFITLSCVTICCMKNRYKTLKLILDVGGRRVNAGIGNNYAFYVACAEGCVNIVKLLLTRDDVDPSSTIIGGGGISAACTRNQIEIVKLLLHYAWAVPSKSTLEHICEKKYIKLLKLLFDSGRVIPTINMLISALKKNDYDVTKLLLKDRRLVISQYNSVNEENEAYKRLLEQAFDNKTDIEIMKIICDDPRIDLNYKNIAIVKAINNQDRNLFLYLYTNPRVDLTRDINAIKKTITKIDWFLFNMLLDYKTSDGRRIDPSVEHNYLLTMAISMYNGRNQDLLRIIKRLLEDPRVNPADTGNERAPNALEQALSQGVYDVATLLLNDPRVHIHDLPGKLNEAIETNDVQLVQFLITLPEFEISKENLRRAFQLANENQDNEMATLLVQRFDFHNNPMDEFTELNDNVLSDLKPLVMRKQAEQDEKAEIDRLTARIRHDELLAKKQAEEDEQAEQLRRVELLLKPKTQEPKRKVQVHRLVSRHKEKMLYDKKNKNSRRR